MPIYDYQCGECGLRFEQRKDHYAEKGLAKCSCCGGLSEMVMPTDVNFTISTQTEGMAPQNTGYSGVDTNVDRVIGQDAEKRWTSIEERNAHKRGLLEGTDKTKKDLSRTPDGDYRVMSAEEKGASEKANLINNVAMQLHKKRRRKSLKPAE